MPGQATVTIRDKQWQVGVANTSWEMAQGLGGLPELAPGIGMLFDLGWEQTVQMTTVPMLFKLDIAFFSQEFVITEVYRDVEPGYVITSTSPARYFLEVNAGELEGIDSGDRASVELLPLEELTVTTTDWVSIMISLMGFVVMGMLMVSVMQGLVKGMLDEPEKSPALLPKTERRTIAARGLKTHWFERGMQAGKTDGWMDIENTLKETAQSYPGINDAQELVWTDIDLWEETDHFNILYGSKMWQDARGDLDLYLDLKSEFWEGYLAGRKEIGRDIYRMAKGLVKSSAPLYLPQTAGKRGEVLYAVNLASPEHAEDVILENGTAVLKRYLKPVVRFKPTEEQRRRIGRGKGYLHIFSGQIVERFPYLPQTRGQDFKPGEIVMYQGEKVRVSEQIGDRVNIFIPSRQELVWVKPDKLERIQPALPQDRRIVLSSLILEELTAAGLGYVAQEVSRAVEERCQFSDWLELWDGTTFERREPYRGMGVTIPRLVVAEIGIRTDLTYNECVAIAERIDRRLKGADVIVLDDGTVFKKSFVPVKRAMSTVSDKSRENLCLLYTSPSPRD